MPQLIQITAPGLDSFVGNEIGDICPCDYDLVKDEEGHHVNHCAHFVSHVLKLNDDLKMGKITCAGMTKKGSKLKSKGAGACLRVNEIFNDDRCLLLPSGAKETGCLIYITKLTNFDADGMMGTQPKKHIGIYLAGDVWHYSNTDQEVKRWKKDDWISKLSHAYGGHTSVKYTTIPEGATFLTLTQVLGLDN